jgi:hypothetical protein
MKPARWKTKNRGKLKMVATAEKKTIRESLLELIEEKIQVLKKTGLLPKGKG